MNVLITGIGGFIGSHCLEYYLRETDWNIVGIDSFRHKGTHSRIKEFYNIGSVNYGFYNKEFNLEKRVRI